MATATAAGFEGWTVAVARQAFVFLGAAVRSLGERGGTILHITGGPARRANPRSAALWQPAWQPCVRSRTLPPRSSEHTGSTSDS